VPLVLVALGLSRLLPAPRTAASVRKFDGVGAALLVTWISAILLALAVRPGPFGPLLSLGLGLLGLLSFVLFLVREQRCQNPLIDLAHFGNADFAIMNLASIAVNLAAFGVLLLVPYYFMRVAGMTVVAAGVILALGAGGAVIGSWLAARLARHAHLGRLAFFGAVLCAGGLWMVSAWTPTTSRESISLALFIQGLGLGLFQVAYTDYVAASLPVGARGVAGSLTILTRTIGVIAGATSLSAAQAYYEREALSAGTAVADAFLAGFQSTFRHVAVGLALGIALSMARPRTWLGRT
jgi:predicted MFS family arabinose efflux permease